MKPVGPIPPGFADQTGELAIGGRPVSSLVSEAGATPLFVYSADMIAQRISDLREHLPASIRLNYAIKANSFAPLLNRMAALVDGFDIASRGELEMALASGMKPSSISFAGPGKGDDELAAAIEAGVTINLESEHEAERALAIGRRGNLTPCLAIRVNPRFELRGSGMKMGGGAKPFGIDAERIPALVRELATQDCEWRGLHIFTGSQSLDAQAVLEAQANVLALADQIARDSGIGIPLLNMGGGFGIPYFPGDKPLDLARLGQGISVGMQNLPSTLSDTEFHIELGRYLVGEAGVYLTRILDRKESYGETYLITDGGLHHQLAASGNFGTVVRRNYPVGIATRFDKPAEETVNIVGRLCTPLDRLADKVRMPKAGVGDIVAVFCAGAYGASASPSAFLGHGPAAEILV
ncbi:pyridoxal-dependent decarboxylase, exosortase A system-associated [Erythrobacter litoralis]|uniref:pyridoxal-dependent decarboxylase, exosortase A system-associated n=1 Tax=Erythrobacter litoralis TaxID=39960 RepID=UPI002434AF86|nr:pyridoxal-dependent decarboxylase, exosortase A system-associated [Erythrobacter litoralis]MDG6078278.1 pyridoxal-dependent decarboxylase, exosortase A system-associated [Erythrobacter litoralis]